LIVDGEGVFEQHVFILGNNFKIDNEQLLEAYNGGQCIMVLIKNMVTTSKGDRYLRAQQYIVFTKIVEEAI
jgi:hypothetical protein